MTKVRIKHLDPEDTRELEVATTWFENLCGACDNFGDPVRCPFYGKVLEDTFWKTEVRCDKFWD